MAADTFQKFKSSINRGVTTISVKTSSSLEKAKIKTHIESVESEIQRIKMNIGECAYAKWEKGDMDFSTLNEQFAAVWEKKEEIRKLNEELNAIDERDNQILGATSTPVQEVPTPAPAAAPGAIICPNCGTQYQADARFCRKCGTKLQ